MSSAQRMRLSAAASGNAFIWGVCLASFNLGICLASLDASAAEKTPSGAYHVIRIHGSIDPGTANYLQSSILEAERKAAPALIVELDTPGGLVSSVKTMAQAIDQSSVPVIVYVEPSGASATSAGALLALSSHWAVMAPGTNLGAAHPVDSSGKDIAGAMGEKVLNDTVAFARAQAEVHGRDPALAEGIVAKSQSYSAQAAFDRKIVEALAPDLDSLMQKLAGHEFKVAGGKTVRMPPSPGFERVEMTWGQALLHGLANPNIASMLMGLGVLCIYVEITSGASVVIPGIVGALCLLVAFVSFELLPIRSGGLLLLILGVALLVLEPFVTAHGAFAVGGLISFVLGLLWVMDPASTAMQLDPAVWVPMVIVLGGGIGLIAWQAMRSRRLVDRALVELKGGTNSGLSGYSGQVTEVFADGRLGKARIRGETWDFECAEALKMGDSVKVMRMDGMKAIVLPI